VVALHVGLQHRGDPGPLCFGRRYVALDEVGMGVDYREFARRRASEQIRSAGRLVVQELAKEHANKPRGPGPVLQAVSPWESFRAQAGRMSWLSTRQPVSALDKKGYGNSAR
jgi:hypothetical protein